jgi:membrane-associated protease RseP (regulator of RpoE activity)
MQGLQRVGIGILVLLMAVAVFNDIQRLFAA